MRGTNNRTAAGSGKAGKAQRTRNRAAVPVLQEGKGDAKQLHPVHEVRAELERGAGGGPAPVSHATHRVYRDGDRQWCSDCKIYF